MDQNPYRSPDSYEIVRRSPSGSKTLIHGRFVGWLYLAVFGLDLILSVVALRAPTFEFASNVASVVDGVFSFAIPFMAYTGYVKPKGLFWALFGFYFLMLL